MLFQLKNMSLCDLHHSYNKRVSVAAGDDDNSRMTSRMTSDEGRNVSRQPTVLQLTSPGTDLDPDTSNLINGLKFTHAFCLEILKYKKSPNAL